jgi:hypothetical protein
MSILKHGEVENFSSSCPYVYVDGVYLKRSWGGEIQNVSILAAIGVNEDGCREIIGVACCKKDSTGRCIFSMIIEGALPLKFLNKVRNKTYCCRIPCIIIFAGSK